MSFLVPTAQPPALAAGAEKPSMVSRADHCGCLLGNKLADKVGSALVPVR